MAEKEFIICFIKQNHMNDGVKIKCDNVTIYITKYSKRQLKGGTKSILDVANEYIYIKKNNKFGKKDIDLT